MKWTVYQMVASEKSVGYSKLGEFDTKRQAVECMDAIREPKSPVYRNNRDYIITAKKGR